MMAGCSMAFVTATMEPNTMDLRRVRYFVAAAEDLHFGRTAKRMNIVQSAVSQQIKRFEDELAIDLFDRSSREIRLTEAGFQMLHQCRQLLEQADKTVRVANDAVAGTRGRIRMAFIDNAICTLLPPLIREYRLRYPNVELRLQTMDRSDQITALLDRHIDIGVLPGPIQLEHLESAMFVSSPLVAVFPRRHLLASRRSIRLEDLTGEAFVLFPASIHSRLLEIVIATCADSGFTPSVIQEAHHLHTVLALVEAGVGVTLAPPWVAHAGVTDVAFVPLENHTPTYDLVFVKRRDSTNIALQRLWNATAIKQYTSTDGPVRA
jgi:DNA-binding transcriptional LysR family regulator